MIVESVLVLMWSSCYVVGSFAAGVQAAAGNVAAGGIYATLQSAAMGGYGVAAVSGAVQTVGAAIVGTAGVAGLKKSKC